jgi:hypothetical protein
MGHGFLGDPDLTYYKQALTSSTPQGQHDPFIRMKFPLLTASIDITRSYKKLCKGLGTDSRFFRSIFGCFVLYELDYSKVVLLHTYISAHICQI